MIADFMTLKEHFGSLEDLTIAYIGDGRNNIANSLLVTSAILGVNVKIISPEILQPEADIVELAQKHNNGANLTITDDISEVKGVDILYTDVWVSMGEEVDFKSRIDLLLPYQINVGLLAKSKIQMSSLCIVSQHFMILILKSDKKFMKNIVWLS